MDVPIFPAMRWLRRSAAGSLLIAVVFYFNPLGLRTWVIETAVHQEQARVDRIMQPFLDSLPHPIPYSHPSVRTPQ